ncbi:MAG: SMI1/KNR4 family protein [Deltaproteobacteria bacterium]|nr:SMI1/KNR4 family protein [Deltaproteobacteria bacterium]
MSVEELQRMMPAPREPVFVPCERDWKDAEAALGTRLPSDYKAFLGAYGSGRVSQFLEIFNPASPHEYNNLVACWKKQVPIFEYIQSHGTQVSLNLHPAKPGLLPIGQTDNGDMIFFVTGGPPDDWRVAVLISRAQDVEIFDLRLTEFLTSGLRHEIDALPDDLERVFDAADAGSGSA